MANEYGSLADDAQLQRLPVSSSGMEEWEITNPGTYEGEGENPYQVGDVITLEQGQAYAPPDEKTFIDFVNEFSLVDVIPFANMIPEVRDSIKYNKLSNMVADGSATLEEKDELFTYLAYQQRGATPAYKIANISKESLPFMVEYLVTKGVGSTVARAAVRSGITSALGKGVLSQVDDVAARALLTGLKNKTATTTGINAVMKSIPERSAGLKIAGYFAGARIGDFGRAAGTFAKKRMAGEASEQAARIMAKTAMPALGQAATEGAIMAAMRPDIVTSRLLQNMTPQFALNEDEQGNLNAVLIDEGDGFLQAFAKAYGDVAIEFMSEETGDAFIALRGMFGPGASKILKATGIKSYMDNDSSINEGAYKNSLEVFNKYN
jgi:predicted Fe-Mo cluster-binding NifX family protein